MYDSSGQICCLLARYGKVGVVASVGPQCSPLLQLCTVISWPISVIVKSRSQLEHATKDKLEGGDDKVSRCKGSDFSNL